MGHFSLYYWMLNLWLRLPHSPTHTMYYSQPVQTYLVS